MKDSPPMKLFMDKQARPVAVHSPAPIPIHWADQVKAGLDRDVRLGVIERVPVNEPTSWCSRMVITPKHDGSPRRVIDYQPVNDHCPRQTHHTRSPWQVASAVPPNAVKSVCDAWHGYHSVPIHPADRHITTFITQYGRYRYRTAPQGLLSAGDAYTQRSDEIIGDFANHVKCVDDSLVWGTDIESNFTSICAFLEKCSLGGIVFNPKKFQFAEEEVAYLGFRLTKEGLQPTAEFLHNIRSFPSPKSITDVRSWYGAINQISYTFATSQLMLPFRLLLRPQVPFYWSEELEAIFKESKEEILRQCAKGVRLFDINLPTGLATDWSKSCMGWWLVQKHCACPGVPTLACCRTGWQTVFCGSRFCSGAESRYHPIEGEAAAAVHGLDKTSMYTLGLKQFLLALDHKPLIKIFGDAPLESISNPRLFNFKQKTLKYRFTPVHVPGKQHVVPDTLSRRSDSLDPSSPSNVLPAYSDTMGPPAWVSPPIMASYTIASYSAPNQLEDETEAFVAGLAMSRLEEFNNPPETLSASISAPPIQAITWSMLESACQACPQYQLLHSAILAGLSPDSKDWDQQLLPYFRHRHLLTTVGPVVLINDRPVVPLSLRPRVLDHMHAGHPGLSTMCQRMASSLYWPDYKQDLTRSKLSCSTCRSTAPSNPALPPSPPSAPKYPFQSIVCDFFTLSGKTYAAVADRYSNWLSILQLKRDTSQELIDNMRNYFATFGIAELLSSDGASIFTSKLFSEFCTRWGIDQRISSAYHPRSNKRAEVAVKSAKRLIRDSLGPGGSLNTDALARALLSHRNTPDPVTGLSPSQIIFGRNLRDFTPCFPGHYTPRQEWRMTADQREVAMARRHVKTAEALHQGSRQLPPLIEGDFVSIQDQAGNTPKRWSKTGRVLEALGHDSYLVKVDGSQRVTKRNRQFLRRVEPFKADTNTPSMPVWTVPPTSAPVSAETVEIIDPVDIDLPTDPEPTLQVPPPGPVLRPRRVHPGQDGAHVGPAAPTQPVRDLPHAGPVQVLHDGNALSNTGPVHEQGIQPLQAGPVQPQQHHVHLGHARPHMLPVHQFTPPPPGVPHYNTLRRLEEETRRQVQSSKELHAYLAFMMTSQAMSSSGWGGIPSSYAHAQSTQLQPATTYQFYST